MRNNLLLIAFFCLQIIGCRSVDQSLVRNSKIPCVETVQILVDTTPAVIPEDYFSFCDCTLGLYDIAPICHFEDLYRLPFSVKRPAKYQLCSIISFDSIEIYEKDTMVCILHMTVSSYGIFYSPYALDYWLPDRLMAEDGLIYAKELYEQTVSKIETERCNKIEMGKISLFIFPEEFPTLAMKAHDCQTNLFLLWISDDEQHPCAYQFYTKGEYELSSLYTPLQYYRYLANRYKEYMKN